MSKTIYLVSQGEYSDYFVRWALPTRELAEQSAKIVNKHESDYYQAFVEELTLYDAPPEPTLVLVARTMVKDGEILERQTYEREIVHYENIPHRSVSIDTAPTGAVWVVVQDADFEWVRKTFSDRVAKIRAKQLGL